MADAVIEAKKRRLLCKTYAALPIGGGLIVSDAIVDDLLAIDRQREGLADACIGEWRLLKFRTIQPIEAVAHFGQFNILVNNAGIRLYQTVVEASAESRDTL